LHWYDLLFAEHRVDGCVHELQLVLHQLDLAEVGGVDAVVQDEDLRQCQDGDEEKEDEEEK